MLATYWVDSHLGIKSIFLHSLEEDVPVYFNPVEITQHFSDDERWDSTFKEIKKLNKQEKTHRFLFLLRPCVKSLKSFGISGTYVSYFCG